MLSIHNLVTRRTQPNSNRNNDFRIRRSKANHCGLPSMSHTLQYNTYKFTQRVFCLQCEGEFLFAHDPAGRPITLRRQPIPASKQKDQDRCLVLVVVVVVAFLDVIEQEPFRHYFVANDIRQATTTTTRQRTASFRLRPKQSNVGCLHFI